MEWNLEGRLFSSTVKSSWNFLYFGLYYVDLFSSLINDWRPPRRMKANGTRRKHCCPFTFHCQIEFILLFHFPIFWTVEHWSHSPIRIVLRLFRMKGSDDFHSLIPFLPFSSILSISALICSRVSLVSSSPYFAYKKQWSETTCRITLRPHRRTKGNRTKRKGFVIQTVKWSFDSVSILFPFNITFSYNFSSLLLLFV